MRNFDPYLEVSFLLNNSLLLKELASNTVGVNNSIFDVELNSLLTLYKTLVTEINTLEKKSIFSSKKSILITYLFLVLAQFLPQSSILNTGIYQTSIILVRCSHLQESNRNQ